MNVLSTIPDPEMPLSIVELGLVEAVRVNPTAPNQPLSSGKGGGRGEWGGGGASVEIDLLPTFVGCPALDMIAGDVRTKVGKLPGVGEVKVNWLFDPPWSVDRISQQGRQSLIEHGVTVPAHGRHLNVPGHMPGIVTLRTSAVPCPFCGSTSTHLESSFGPTRCRMIYYCNSCRNSFEHMKQV
jgi:ring-1,2-phenylacetyl-CoA epoxidase subunit PaaD